ncbi:unnamed protein product [Echinostoma caproni]|uniref:DNA topoisomerase n=1 Tax=Echinostoma caproni TaxID=27848 RepID=A0A183AB97_9TREM|nr:unnamed protein product [Echinostoma caproni]
MVSYTPAFFLKTRCSPFCISRYLLATGSDLVRTCPMCRQPSLFVPLRMGLEPAFYVDRRFPTHCFNPCGHMASEKTCL